MAKKKGKKSGVMDREAIASLPDDVLLTEDELCVFLGIGRTTAWRFREQERIPCVKLGSCVRYHLGAVRKWMREKAGMAA